MEGKYKPIKTIQCPHCGETFKTDAFYKHCQVNKLCQCGETLDGHLQCSNCGIMVGSRHIEISINDDGICEWCSSQPPKKVRHEMLLMQ